MSLSSASEWNQRYRQEQDPSANLDTKHPRYLLWQQRFKILVAMILPRYRTVVDIGCGVGGLVDLINRTTDKRAVGVDISQVAIERAKKWFPKWRYEVGDIRTWKPSEPTDMVLATDSYYLLPPEERMATLRHIYGYLNQGGALLITYPHNPLLSGHKRTATTYTLNIASELFPVFKPQQVVRAMIIDYQTPAKVLGDRWEEGSWEFYVGEKV